VEVQECKKVTFYTKKWTRISCLLEFYISTASILAAGDKIKTRGIRTTNLKIPSRNKIILSVAGDINCQRVGKSAIFGASRLNGSDLCAPTVLLVIVCRAIVLP
jgi:hypothetical protein